jgi:hypothetical protein
LPEPSKIVLKVIIYRLPNDIKDLIKGEKLEKALKRVESSRSGVKHSNSENDPTNLSKF